MKLLVLFDNHYPEGLAMANRLQLYARALQSVGVEVTVLAGKYKKLQADKKEFMGHWHYSIDLSSPLDKIPFFNRFTKGFAQKKLLTHMEAVSKDYDVIWSIGYAWKALLQFSAICKKNNSKVIIELNEFPHSVIASRMQTEKGNERLRKKLFEQAYPVLDGFVVISDKLGNLAANYKSDTAKTIKVPILVDTQAYAEKENIREKRFKAPFLFHAGTLTEEKDGILEVFEAFGRLSYKYPNFRFVLSNKVTLPHMIQQIDAVIDKYKIQDKVVFHNHLSREAIHEHLSTCACVVINKPDNLRNGYNFSTKLGECMSYGIPIVTTPVGEAANYLIDEQNALLVNSADVDAICAKINFILDHPDAAIQLGNNAMQTARQAFDHLNYAAALKSFLEQL